MEKIARSFTQKLNRFHKRVESLLDAEEHQRVDPDAPPFEASRDPAMVRGLSMGLPDDHVDRAIVTFGRLSGLYEAGVLLENHDGIWKPHAIFQEGIAKPLRDEQPSVHLPKATPLTALKAPTGLLLKKLNLSHLDTQNRYAAILVKPVPDFAYLLLTSLPDLWLKDHLERTVNALADGFAG